MLLFLAGQAVSVTFNLADLELSPTSVEYRVVDRDDVELIPQTLDVTFTPGSGEYTVTIPADKNQVAPVPAYDGRTWVPATNARTVYLYVTGTGGAAGQIVLEQSYLITLEGRLQVPQASFQTLAGAEETALDLVDIDAWSAATDTQKGGALMEARNRISRISFRFKPEDWQSRVMPVVGLHDFNFMTASEWASLDSFFKHDLRRAQVLEAARILTKDDSEASREAGVTNKTIGESSTSWVSSRRPAFPIGDRALRVLAKYISAPRIGRA